MTENIEQNSPPDSKEEILAKLDELQNIIAKTSKAKKITTICSTIGIIIIIIILCVFILSIYSFISNYNTDKLGLALQKSIPKIAKTTEAKKLLDQVQKELLPNYQKALIKQININSEKLQKQTLATAEDINKYMQNDMKEALLKGLRSSMITAEKEILTKYHKLNLSEERITAVLNESNALFTEKLSDNLNAKLSVATQKLTNLNNSFIKLQKSLPKDKQLNASANIHTYENQFIESLLELLVYQMNPAKGKLPALSVGGVK
ncbi:MAG TPA: hypothetical protein QF753_20590 [Victivallales bacterium]|nr:hypothetical protein [Victivallales bacterium]